MSIHIYNNITHCGITTTVGEMDNCISIFHTKRHAKGIHTHIVQQCITSKWWSGLANASIRIGVTKSLLLYLSQTIRQISLVLSLMEYFVFLYHCLHTDKAISLTFHCGTYYLQWLLQLSPLRYKIIYI